MALFLEVVSSAAWRVLGLQMKEVTSRYGGYRRTCSVNNRGQLIREG
jgi:hypothetical protein